MTTVRSARGILALALALSACTRELPDELEVWDPSQPPLTPEPQLSYAQVKQFVLAWPPTPGADRYEVLERVSADAEHELVADTTDEIISLTVPLHFRRGASYIVRACNQHGCTDSQPVEASGTLADAVGYFQGSNTEPDDAFGDSVALSDDGRTFAIGAPNERGYSTGINGDQSNWGLPTGAVYVFVRDDQHNWSQQAYVKASNTDYDDYFGSSVALSADGNTLVVGAEQEDSNATGIDGDQTNEDLWEAGAVYVFVRDENDSWSQQAYVKPSNTHEGQGFGGSVAISDDGDTLVVGARGEHGSSPGIDGDPSGDPFLYAGAVYVFTRDETDSWSQQAYVKPSNPQPGDEFGISVALSGDGDTLAVGAEYAAGDPGAAYVFVRDDADAWSQQAYLDASKADENGWLSSRSIALSNDGSTVALGVHGTQAVYVFSRDGAAGWSEQAFITSAHTEAADYFAYSTALSEDGNILAVGAWREDSDAIGIDGDAADNSSELSGAAYVFVRDQADVWSQRAYVKASDSGTYDHYGVSITLDGSGQTLAVGAPSKNGFAGAVYMY